MSNQIKSFTNLRLEPAVRQSAFLEKAMPAVTLAVFLLAIAGWTAVYMGALPAMLSGRLALATVLFAVLATLSAAAQRLPLQNVLLGAAAIGLIGGGVQFLGAATGIPFGAITYTDAAGPLLFNLLPWAMPLVWVVLIFNARGVARLILRPWRKTRTYGLRVIGLTCVLAMLFDLGLEPFACKVNRFWIWHTTAGTPTWHGAPWVNFIAWLLTALLILVFVTPALINKKPVQHPPQYQPLVVWLAINTLFAAAAAVREFWWAAGVVIASNLIIGVLAIRGARW